MARGGGGAEGWRGGGGVNPPPIFVGAEPAGAFGLPSGRRLRGRAAGGKKGGQIGNTLHGRVRRIFVLFGGGRYAWSWRFSFRPRVFFFSPRWGAGAGANLFLFPRWRAKVFFFLQGRDLPTQKLLTTPGVPFLWRYFSPAGPKKF
jgi:hypothetical protein